MPWSTRNLKHGKFHLSLRYVNVRRESLAGTGNAPCSTLCGHPRPAEHATAEFIMSHEPPVTALLFAETPGVAASSVMAVLLVPHRIAITADVCGPFHRSTSRLQGSNPGGHRVLL